MDIVSNSFQKTGQYLQKDINEYNLMPNQN